MANAKFDLKLIHEFDGSTSVVDKTKRVELTCHLCGDKQVELVIPLQLTGGALDIYQQLSDNEKANYWADQGCTIQSLCDGPLHNVQTPYYLDIVDVFFVALKKLAVLFGELPVWTFVYTFVAGLLAQVKQLLRVSTSIKAMPTEELLKHAWAIIRDEAGSRL